MFRGTHIQLSEICIDLKLTLFLSINSSSTMLTIFGGRVDDLKPMLTDERFAEDWEPRILDRYGLTMAKFNSTVLPVARKIDTKPYEKAD